MITLNMNLFKKLIVKQEICNATAIKSKRLPEHVKNVLKQDFKAHWNRTEMSFSFPKQYEVPAALYLENEGIEFDFSLIQDRYFEVSKREQKIECLDVRKEMITQEGLTAPFFQSLRIFNEPMVCFLQKMISKLHPNRSNTNYNQMKRIKLNF